MEGLEKTASRHKPGTWTELLTHDAQTLGTAQLGCDPQTTAPGPPHLRGLPHWPTRRPARVCGPPPPRGGPRGPHRWKPLGLSCPTSPAGNGSPRSNRPGSRLSPRAAGLTANLLRNVAPVSEDVSGKRGAGHLTYRDFTAQAQAWASH